MIAKCLRSRQPRLIKLLNLKQRMNQHFRAGKLTLSRIGKDYDCGVVMRSPQLRFRLASYVRTPLYSGVSVTLMLARTEFISNSSCESWSLDCDRR